LSPKPLSDIREYVFSSAFRDRRFSPLEKHEIPALEVGISLLVNYEDAASYMDWEVGTHGIIIDFQANNSHFSATYLPEVALEQGTYALA
jgi:AMMECR1 domain-containing protein